MARLPRIHTPRSFRLFISANNANNTSGDTETLNASKRFQPFQGGDNPSQYSIFLDVGAGLTGTFTIEGTNVPDPEMTTSADWVVMAPTILPGGGSLTFAGSAAKLLVRGTDEPYEWICLNYTHTSGSATFRSFAKTSAEK